VVAGNCFRQGDTQLFRGSSVPNLGHHLLGSAKDGQRAFLEMDLLLGFWVVCV
jgi:hypothetical protein